MNNPTTDSRLWALVRDLEAQGYGIFSTRQRTGFMLQMSDMDLSEVEECAFDRFRVALSEDEDLRAAVGPFLAKNRPHPEENA